ncbi:MAG: hypothetical protein GY711_06140 [bacterium]|nr:hypothetical protein [bacterium]
MVETLLYGLLALALLSRCIPMLIVHRCLWCWHLIPKNRLFNVYLHLFVGDDEPVFHGHPYASWSLCLWGNLREHELAAGSEVVSDVGLGHTVYRRASRRHYLSLGSRRALTLFLTGPTARDRMWYYYPPDRERVPAYAWPQYFDTWGWSWRHMRYGSVL